MHTDNKLKRNLKNITYTQKFILIKKLSASTMNQLLKVKFERYAGIHSKVSNCAEGGVDRESKSRVPLPMESGK